MWAAGARVPPQRDDVGATGQPGFDDVDEGFIDGERLVAGPIRDTAQSACARKGIGSSGDVWVTIPSTQIASWGRASCSSRNRSACGHEIGCGRGYLACKVVPSGTDEGLVRRSSCTSSEGCGGVSPLDDGFGVAGRADEVDHHRRCRATAQ